MKYDFLEYIFLKIAISKPKLGYSQQKSGQKCIIMHLGDLHSMYMDSVFFSFFLKLLKNDPFFG